MALCTAYERPLMILLIILATLLNQAFTFSFNAKSRSSTRSDAFMTQNMNTDLTSLVRVPLDGQSEIYSQALQLLESMQSSPSCDRLAASRLLTSCQSIDEEYPSSEVALDKIKSIYSAQLAVCELKGAGLAIPPHCDGIVPTESAKENGRFFAVWSERGRGTEPPSSDHGNVDDQQLNRCLKSLESKPQWWTSYSNSRQNALVMCRAARVDIEKDDLIKLQISLVKTSSNIETTLMRALEEADSQLLRQRDFANAIGVFQKHLKRDLELSNEEAQSLIKQLTTSLDSITKSILGKLSSAAMEFQTEVAQLMQNIRKSSSEAVNFNKSLGKVFQQVLQGSSELAARQTAQWDTTSSLALQVQNSLETINGHEIEALLGAFHDMHYQLQISNELVSTMHLRQNALDERLLKLDESFEKLDTKALAFHNEQRIQAEAQSNFFAELQGAMHLTSRQIANITATAAGLENLIDHVTTKVTQAVSFTGTSDTVLQWSWLGLVVFVLYLVNSRYAAFATAAIATFCLLKSSLPALPDDLVLVYYSPGYHFQLALALKIGAVLCILSVVARLTHTYGNHLIMLKGGFLSFLPTIDILGSRRKHTIYRV